MITDYEKRIADLSSKLTLYQQSSVGSQAVDLLSTQIVPEMSM